MLPPPASAIARRLAHQEERRLEVDVDLEIPVVLSDLVDVAAPAQHGSDVSEMVDAAVAGDDPTDQVSVAGDVTKVDAQALMAITRQRSSYRFDRGIDVDGTHQGP